MGFIKKPRVLFRATSASSDDASSPPPSYAETEKQEQAKLHDDLANRVAQLKVNDGPAALVGDKLPTADEAFVHLKLLHAIHTLRKRVSGQDGLFGLYDDSVGSRREKHDSGETPSESERAMLSQLREKRWAVYLARAAHRFGEWWQGMRVRAQAGQLSLATLKSNISGEEWKDWTHGHGERLVICQTSLPPLDVLMCWHAFMLNPQCYLEDCLRQDMMALWHVGMPWDAVNSALASGQGSYEPGVDAAANFADLTGLCWDNLAGPSTVRLQCPKSGCQGKWEMPWTEGTQSEGQPRFQATTETTLPQGQGLADPGFYTNCPSCDGNVDHDALRAGKFRRESESLIAAFDAERRFLAEKTSSPMPGCILNNLGGPDTVTATTDFRLFPNRLIQGMFRKGMTRDWASVAEIRDAIDGAMKDGELAAYANGSRWHTVHRGARIRVRKMLSRYWDNSSAFSLDLVGAVVRQGSFVEEMENIDWLHSPAGPSTMARLVTKYVRFMEIMSSRLGLVTVPTLDVDIMWHTHQLTPRTYYEYCMKHCKGTYVDHDDKIGETMLHSAFTETTRIYQKRYKEPYSECTCWYCETIRAGTAPSTGSLFKSDNTFETAESRMLYNPSHPTTSDPDKGPHISMHSAVRPINDGKSHSRLQLDAANAQLKHYYSKAVHRASKAGRRPPPSRPDCDPRRAPVSSSGRNNGAGVLEANIAATPYYVLGASGGGSFLLGGMFMQGCGGGQSGGGVYAGNPGCANMVAGAAGNCAAGGCGGAVGGGCGGGAGGGAGGGCGGGAGGCGGGGGGGGGCGGGGGS